MTASRPDLYALLGLAADADGDAIRAAYRALAKLHHPDLAEDATPDSIEQFIRIQEAYDVLRDPERRAAYDQECAAEAELAAMLRQQRAFAERQAMAAGARAIHQPAVPPPRRPVLTRSRLYFLGAAAMVVGALALVTYQRRQQAELEKQITVVRVDPRPAIAPADGGTHRSGPPDLSVLAKEMERLSRLQVERVEIAKKKVQAELENVQRQAAQPAKPPAAAAPPVPRPAKVDCAGEGRAFSLVHHDDQTSVSYNGGPMVRATIRDLGTGIVLVSEVEPTKRISLGFWKGDKDRTIVVVTDAAGHVFQTFGVDCTGPAF